MTSVICQNFAQNAWRKDLCSNCFKSKDEHGATTSTSEPGDANSASNNKLGTSANDGNNGELNSVAAVKNSTPQRYSTAVGSLQPPWKTGLSFASSSNGSVGGHKADGGGNDLRSPQLLKSAAFLFANSAAAPLPAKPKVSEAGKVGNPGSDPAPAAAAAPRDEGETTRARTQPAAGTNNDSPAHESKDSVSSDEKTASSGHGPPPACVESAARSSFLINGDETVTTVLNGDPSTTFESDASDSNSGGYRPKFSVHDFKQAYGAHAAEVDVRLASLLRSSPPKSSTSAISAHNIDLSSKCEESASSLHSESNMSSSAGSSEPRVIIHKVTKSILKPKKREPRPKRNKVYFPSDEQKEVEVIGFGGDETYFSGSDEEDDHHPPSDDDDDADLDLLDKDATPEERRLMSLTDENTNYNGNPSNLLYGKVPEENQIETVNPPMNQCRGQLEDICESEVGSDVSSLDAANDQDAVTAPVQGQQAAATKKKQTPQVLVKPFVQGQTSWQDSENMKKPAPASWLYKHQSQSPKGGDKDEQNASPAGSNEACRAVKSPKSFLHSGGKVPIQHVAPLVLEKPALALKENCDPDVNSHQAKFAQIQKSFNGGSMKQPLATPKPPILKPKPKVPLKPASKNGRSSPEKSTASNGILHSSTSDLAGYEGTPRINEDSNAKPEQPISGSRNAQSMHDLLLSEEDQSDSVLNSSGDSGRIYKSHEILKASADDSPSVVPNSNSIYSEVRFPSPPRPRRRSSSSDDCASNSSDVEYGPKSLPYEPTCEMLGRSEPVSSSSNNMRSSPIGKAQGTNEKAYQHSPAFSPATMEPPEKLKRYKAVHRSNSDLSSANNLRRDAEMNIRNAIGSVMLFASGRHKYHTQQSNGTSTKRQAPQPPLQRKPSNEQSPAPILKNSSKQSGYVERRSREKKAATLSSATNGASVQFLLNPNGVLDSHNGHANFRESSPSPTMKKKQRRSRSLPRPTDLFFLSSEMNNHSSSYSSRRNKGCFSPMNPSPKSSPEAKHKVTMTVSSDSPQRGRNTAKKKTKNFLMKLLKRGSSSTNSQGNESNGNVGKERSKSAKYSFEHSNHQEEKKSKLQIVHPLDMRKHHAEDSDSEEGVAGDRVDAINGDSRGRMNGDIVVNRVLPVQKDESLRIQGSYKKIAEDDGPALREAMRLPGQTTESAADSDAHPSTTTTTTTSSSSSAAARMRIQQSRHHDGEDAAADTNNVGVAVNGHVLVPAAGNGGGGRPKPPPPPRSSSSRGNGGNGVSEGTSYANLGGARQAITPTKPDRSNSIREASTSSSAAGRGPSTFSAPSKRESPGVEPPPLPVTAAPTEPQLSPRRNKDGSKEVRKASPYAVTPCPNIDPTPTPPPTPPGGYNVPRPTASVVTLLPTPSARLPRPSPTSAAAAGFVDTDTDAGEPTGGPGSFMNASVGQSPAELLTPPSLSSSSGTSVVLSGGGRQQPQQYARSYSSRLSLRGASSSSSSSSTATADGAGGGSGKPSPTDASSPAFVAARKPPAARNSLTTTPVHRRSLEDNYGAVIAANHQALAQLLDQVQDHSPIPESLRVLEDVQDLRWSDFSVVPDSLEIRVGKRVFVSGVYYADGGKARANANANADVTLMLCGSDLHTVNSGAAGGKRRGSRSPSGRFLPFVVPTVRGFVDMLPARLLSMAATAANGVRQGSVHVLPRLNVTSIQNFRILYGATESYEKSVAFLMLQMVSALKHLQAEGIEDTDASLENFVITNGPSDDSEFRLVLLCDDVVSLLGERGPSASSSSPSLCNYGYGDGDGDDVGRLSLCQAAVAAMVHLLGVADDPADVARHARDFDVPADRFETLAAAFAGVGDLLRRERAGSLTQAKSLLEYVLWGPETAEIDPTAHEASAVEKMVHQWLDLERAHVLNNLIRTQASSSHHRSSSVSSSSNSLAHDAGMDSSPTSGIGNHSLVDGSNSKWLTTFEEYQLMFLVRTSVKSLKDVMFLLASKKTLSEA